MSRLSNSRSDCESMCNKLEGCVAYDIHNHGGYCNVRFESKDTLLASPNQSGYNKWPQGCGNNCEVNYEGFGGNGHCWVKNKGNLIISFTMFGEFFENSFPKIF